MDAYRSPFPAILLDRHRARVQAGTMPHACDEWLDPFATCLLCDADLPTGAYYTLDDEGQLVTRPCQPRPPTVTV